MQVSPTPSVRPIGKGMILQSLCKRNEHHPKRIVRGFQTGGMLAASSQAPNYSPNSVRGLHPRSLGISEIYPTASSRHFNRDKNRIGRVLEVSSCEDSISALFIPLCGSVNSQLWSSARQVKHRMHLAYEARWMPNRNQAFKF